MQYMNKSITREALKRLIDNGISEMYVIIDLRDEMDYRNFHITGAINIEYQKFMKMNDYSTILQKEKDVILYCERGGSSIYAAKRLYQSIMQQNSKLYGNTGMGRAAIQIFSLSGGITGYMAKYRY